MPFYHRPDPMLVLEINPTVEFVANHLCLVLAYLGKFLYCKVLLVGPEKIYFKKIYGHIQATIDITRWDPSQDQLIIPVLTLTINLSFL